eukprot:TRINITY_DN1547_c0_g1_i1.p1 TRINITY_DN1547_c0_g1~~TRINITY_DN1547_c0_g1_i1.p1  ORF type:complete len:717 (-),score=108.70 TRINITY_DN1547_c0_g1_i1:407-2557(-)
MSRSDLCLGVKPFFARDRNIDSKELSPSNKIIGRFQTLKSLPKHPNLCQYLDVVVGRHERLFVISEHYESNLEYNIEQGPIDEYHIREHLFYILKALCFLHRKHIFHRALSPISIKFTKDNILKISDYGMDYITDSCSLVNFPIGNPKYMAPERIINNRENEFTAKEDIWSVGIIILHMLLGKLPWRDSDMCLDIMLQTLNFSGYDVHIPLELQRSSNSPYSTRNNIINEDVDEAKLIMIRRLSQLEKWLCTHELDHISDDLKDIIRMCITSDPRERADAFHLIQHHYFHEFPHEVIISRKWVVKPFIRTLYNNDQEYTQNLTVDGVDKKKSKPEDISIEEIFHFWTLAGGDLENELTEELRVPPSILRIPTAVLCDDDISIYDMNDQSRRYNSNIVSISLESLWEQFDNKIAHGMSLSSREHDIVYQRSRVLTFRSLINDYPSSQVSIVREARRDIPPLLRGEIWSCILDVPRPSVMNRIYNSINLDVEGPADNQISLDVPRCHQYNNLLSSPEGQNKLSNILKAWTIYNPNLEYWQGIDSLLAPFLVLNFNSEPRAFFCLQKVITKYLYDFFSKEEPTFLQEYLMHFEQILSFLDPELACHLRDIGFSPNLYAIPWFLTLFTHIFDLEDIPIVMDSLLLSPSSLPLFMATAVLQQMRELLLPLDLNSCILLFSNVPTIDIRKCMEEALRSLHETPESIGLPPHKHNVSYLTLIT